jgi:hypothetical protein
MAFLRFTRDRRGYEHFQLMEPAANRRGPARLLYWFRSPPNVRVGREPFDTAARAALEHQYPDLQFDWPQILGTPIPSAEAERWRERRRQERAARRSAAEREQDVATESADVESDRGLPQDTGEEQALESQVPMRDDLVAAVPGAPPERSAEPSRKHRRRRRGRRGRPDRPPIEQAGDKPSAEERPPDPWIGKEPPS